MAACILVVDDDAGIRQALELMLRKAGYDVLLASDGTSALKAAQQRPPQLIIVDLGLPGGDGFNVIKRIRSMYRLSRIPIAVLTGMHLDENRAKAEQAGAVAFLPKPLDGAELLRVVAEATGRPAKTKDATPTPPAGSEPAGKPDS